MRILLLVLEISQQLNYLVNEAASKRVTVQLPTPRDLRDTLIPSVRDGLMECETTLRTELSVSTAKGKISVLDILQNVASFADEESLKALCMTSKGHFYAAFVEGVLRYDAAFNTGRSVGALLRVLNRLPQTFPLSMAAFTNHVRANIAGRMIGFPGLERSIKTSGNSFLTETLSSYFPHAFELSVEPLGLSNSMRHSIFHHLLKEIDVCGVGVVSPANMENLIADIQGVVKARYVYLGSDQAVTKNLGNTFL